MNFRTFLAIILILILIPAAMAAYSAFKHGAFTIGDGKDINLWGNLIGNGTIRDVACISNCTGYGISSTETNASNLTSGTLANERLKNVVVAPANISAAILNLTASRSWMEKIVLVGNFSVTNRIDIPNYTILEIQGKITSTSPDGVFGIPYLAHDIEIFGGDVEGSTYGITGIGNHNPSRLYIHNINFTKQSNHVIYIGAVHDSIFQNLKISDGLTRGIMIEDGGAAKNENVRIEGNTISNMPGHAISVQVNSKNVTVINNRIYDIGVGNGGIWFVSVIKGSIINNQITNTWTEAIQVTTSQDIIIKNNHIDGVGYDYGISIDSSVRTTIANNNINNTNSTGIEIASSNYSIISGNFLNNIITCADACGGGRAIGINLESSFFGVVTSNIITDLRTPKKMEQGLAETTTGNFSIFANNIVNGWNSSANVSLGTQTITVNNVFIP